MRTTSCEVPSGTLRASPGCWSCRCANDTTPRFTASVKSIRRCASEPDQPLANRHHSQNCTSRTLISIPIRLESSLETQRHGGHRGLTLTSPATLCASVFLFYQYYLSGKALVILHFGRASCSLAMPDAVSLVPDRFSSCRLVRPFRDGIASSVSPLPASDSF